jgi:hypothetical protein
MKMWFTKSLIAFAELLIFMVAFSQTDPLSKHNFPEISNAALESDKELCRCIG